MLYFSFLSNTHYTLMKITKEFIDFVFLNILGNFSKVTWKRFLLERLIVNWCKEEVKAIDSPPTHAISHVTDAYNFFKRESSLGRQKQRTSTSTKRKEISRPFFPFYFRFVLDWDNIGLQDYRNFMCTTLYFCFCTPYSMLTITSWVSICHHWVIPFTHFTLPLPLPLW